MKKQNWTWNTKTRKWIPRNMLYNSSFWCSHCGRKIPKTEAKTNHKGTPRCPKCHKPLRTKPRMYGKRKPKTSTPAENANIIHSLAVAETQDRWPLAPVAESIIKPSKQQFSEKPCNNNIGSMQNMGVWKK